MHSRTALRASARAIVAVGALATTLVVGAASASAQTLTVADSGADSGTCGAVTSCATIQQAVDNAATGDTISVGVGTFAGATIGKAITLNGARAGVDATSRYGERAEHTTRITSTFHVTGGTPTIDGFNLDGIASGQGVYFNGSGAHVQNTVFTNIASGQDAYGDAGAVQDAPLPGIHFTNDLFIGTETPASQGTGIFLSGPAKKSDLVIAHNTFRNFSQTAINVSVTSDLHIVDNVSTGNSSFIVMLESAGTAAAPLEITGNDISDNEGSVFFISKATHHLAISGNRVSGGTGSVVRLQTAFAAPTDEPSSDITVTGNDISGELWGVRANEDSYLGTLPVHGNRIVEPSAAPAGDTAGSIENRDTTGTLTIDASRNWWGCNGAPGSTGCAPAAAGPGTTLVANQLQLGGLVVPATLLTGASGAVSAHLVDAVGGATDADAGTFAVTFSSDAGSIGESPVAVIAGSASTTLAAGGTAGTAHVVATLDGAAVTAATSIEAATRTVTVTDTQTVTNTVLVNVPVSTPTVVAGASAAPVLAAELKGAAATKLSSVVKRGLVSTVRCNQACVVTTKLYVDAATAKRLGLLKRSSRSHAAVVVGTGTVTLAASGSKTVTVQLTKAAARGAKSLHALTITSATTITSAGGTSSASFRTALG